MPTMPERMYRLGRPPLPLIEVARKAALKSPCAKTRRGAVAYNVDRLQRAVRAAYPRGEDQVLDSLSGTPFDPVVSVGFNGQPGPFGCTGTEACRKACGMICMHAEQRAVMAAVMPEFDGRGMRGRNTDLGFCEMIHVKVDDDGAVVAGGGPGCAQCSRLLVEVGMRGIWLYEIAVGSPGNDEWRFYDSVSFHRETMRNENLGDQR